MAQKLLLELKQAVNQISQELKHVLDKPELLRGSECPPELSGCTYPVIQLLHCQAANVLQFFTRRSTLDVSKPGNESDVSFTLVWKRLENLLDIATTEFYAVPFAEVKDGWRRVYADTRILMFCVRLLQDAGGSEDALKLSDEKVDELVMLIDMAIIVAGGNPVKSRDKRWMNNVLVLLADAMESSDLESSSLDQDSAKRQKKTFNDTENRWQDTPAFSTEEPFTPPVTNPIPTMSSFSLTSFQAFLNETPTSELIPIVFPDLVPHWPALTNHPWNKPAYLHHRTFSGRRLVPVEVGRSYTDEDWGQQLIPFSQFLEQYIDRVGEDNRKGYLAQHDLLAQIPALRADVGIPDLCWAEPPLADDEKKGPTCHAEPRLNAWFGPAGTITPLHTDSTHNILVQVVGRKYVRLYHPKYSAALQPRKAENGIDMSNTAELDVGFEEGWDEDVEKRKHANFKNLEYWDCILEPGDSLYIPYGWWHYVRSLSVSFSVSFWWT